MIGALIGDIIGSRFEFNNHKSKEFGLFTKGCQVTDDSIMTLAVAKAIMETEKAVESSFIGDSEDSQHASLLSEMTVKYMQKLGRAYPDCGFGGMFAKWVFSNNPEPYNSFGNGAAMRISPAGFFARTEKEATRMAETITGTTHGHDEGLKGAEAVTVAIFMAKQGYTKREIRDRLSSLYYPLDFTINEIRDTYSFHATCQETVPQAIVSFLESVSFEDAIRNAISLGGDSDTIASITGAIAEAYYGVPDSLRQQALSYLDSGLRSIYDEWCQFSKDECQPGKFKVLTKYIGKFENGKSGEWMIDRENDSTAEHPIHLPDVVCDEVTDLFLDEFWYFSEDHPEYRLKEYRSVLESHNIGWSDTAFRNAEVSMLNAQCILAMIMGVIRADRFSEGTLLSFLENGSIVEWLKRLKSIDDGHGDPVDISEIHFEIGGFFGGFDVYHLVFEESGLAKLRITEGFVLSTDKQFSKEESDWLADRFKSIRIDNWNREYNNPHILDGTQWRLAVKYKDKRGGEWTGSNAYPGNWNELLAFWGIDSEE